MTLKEIYETLEKLENGAELIASIKGEIAKVNDEAKKHRETSEKSSAKIKSILENLGIEDSDDVADKAKNLKTTLDSFSKDGKSPTEVAKEMTKLAQQVADLTKQFNKASDQAKAEKDKRLEIAKRSALIKALTDGKAAAPEQMANLISGNVNFDENEVLSYKEGEKVLSVEDGVKGWLDANKWAVKVEGGGGSGSHSGSDKGDNDPFLAGFKKY